jgi:serine palmitoyltransferase
LKAFGHWNYLDYCFCAQSASNNLAMDLQETQRLLTEYLHELANLFHRVPGSAIFLRYVKSSYQDDPIRSAVELFLFLFAVRYLLAPKYSTKPGVVPLTEDEIDDLVDEWTPEPLVAQPTALEEMEVDKRMVIVGLAPRCFVDAP